MSVERAENDKLPRCGDTVKHRPSGETWFVAWADETVLMAAGWPETMAQTKDCDLVRRASDEEHAVAVERWRCSRDRGLRRQRVLYDYGTDADREALKSPQQKLEERCATAERERDEARKELAAAQAREARLRTLLRHSAQSNHGYHPSGCSSCAEIDAALRDGAGASKGD